MNCQTLEMYGPITRKVFNYTDDVFVFYSYQRS